MKITIIGANSYIARNLINILNIEYKENLTLYLYDYQKEQSDGCNNYESVNVLNMESIKKINSNVDYLFIFTGKTGTMQGFDNYKDFVEINEMALLNILSVYRNNNSKAKIIFPSSRLVYKGSENKLKENAEKEFKTIYAMNKFSCENYLKMYNNMYNIPYLIFRICVPYGTIIPEASSFGTAEFMLKMARSGKDISLYGKGEVRRTLTHIKDLCHVLIAGAMSEKCVNDVFNIGGENFSLEEMAQPIAQKYNVKVIYTDWPETALKIESGSTVFDSSKFDNLTNFKYENKFTNWIKGE